MSSRPDVLQAGADSDSASEFASEVDQEELDMQQAVQNSLDPAQMAADVADPSAVAGPSTYCIHCDCMSHGEDSCPMIAQRLAELEGCEQGSKQGQEGAWEHVAPAVHPLTPEQRALKAQQKKKAARRVRRGEARGQAGRVVTVARGGGLARWVLLLTAHLCAHLQKSPFFYVYAPKWIRSRSNLGDLLLLQQKALHCRRHVDMLQKG